MKKRITIIAIAAVLVSLAGVGIYAYFCAGARLRRSMPHN
jgi:flagellar basal body-associated protein FliL